MSDQQTTHFGSRRVPVEEKARQVRAVFDSVVDRYDLMNDLMSLGIHRLIDAMITTKAALMDSSSSPMRYHVQVIFEEGID